MTNFKILAMRIISLETTRKVISKYLREVPLDEQEQWILDKWLDGPPERRQLLQNLQNPYWLAEKFADIEREEKGERVWGPIAEAMKKGQDGRLAINKTPRRRLFSINGKRKIPSFREFIGNLLK